MSRPWHHYLALAWLAVIMVLGIYNVKMLLIEGKVQFDLLALLPQNGDTKMRLANEFMDAGNVSRRVIIAFGHRDAAQAQHALEEFRHKIQSSSLPIVEHNLKQLETSYKSLFTDLYPYHAGLISKEDRQHLLNGRQDVITQNAISNIFSPFGTFGGNQMAADPFGFYPRFVSAFAIGHAVRTDSEGNLMTQSNDKTWCIYQGEVADKVFSLKLQEKISEILEPVLAEAQTKSGLEIARLGSAFYASAGAQKAQSEISKIGLASTLGIILILLLIFRKPHPVLLALSVVSSGLIGGLAVSLLVFDSIHILAVVFGCSLVGVAVDYALHYYCASFKCLDRFKIFASLQPAMPLGVLTSSIGYSALMIAPFPGIRQMALLACIGLICTFISVAAWGPYFLQSGERKIPPLTLKLQRFLEKLAAIGSIKFLKCLISLTILTLFCISFHNITYDDNIKNFQSLDANLKKQEEEIKTLLQVKHKTTFLAVPGSTLEAILQTEEVLTQELDKLDIHYRALSDLIPSKQRQRENRNLTLKFSEANFTDFAKLLDIDQPFQAADAGFDEDLFVADKKFINELPTGWRELIHIGEEDFIMGRILLNDEMPKNFEWRDFNVTFIDPIEEYTSLFHSYRITMELLIAGLLPAFALLLSLRHGIRAAIAITTPVVWSILATVGILSLSGIGFSMFHAMGLILVLCIGIDYALFLYWRKPEENGLLLLGNTLSAITTILSFGLLILSSTKAVYSFGLVVFLGIVLNFFITTLFLGNIKCKN